VKDLRNWKQNEKVRVATGRQEQRQGRPEQRVTGFLVSREYFPPNVSPKETITRLHLQNHYSLIPRSNLSQVSLGRKYCSFLICYL